MVYRPTGIKKLFHDTRRALARLNLSRSRALQIGITGSQGKTNTTYVITSLLQSLGETVVTDTNLDTTFNVPITALKVKPSTKFVVWELGIDRPGEMAYHLEIARPRIGIMTGISAVHTDKEHMGSIETLISEKRKLLEALPDEGFALMNGDDVNVRGMAPFVKAKILTFGTSAGCDIRVERDQVIPTLHGTAMELIDGTRKIGIETLLVGVHHIYNIMAAYLVFKLAVANGMDLSDEQIGTFRAAVRSLTPLEGRMSVEEGPRGTVLLNDSLRANPTSTRFGLETLSALKEGKRKKIAILAEMGELDKTEDEHRRLGEFIAGHTPDVTVCIGPLQKHVFDGARAKGVPESRIHWVADVFEAAKILDPMVKEGDILYLKGSLLRHVERVLLLLKGEHVGCTVITCPFYHHCPSCTYLHSGYQNVVAPRSGH
jgi:UDP-N-acetylmuramoyl-tripeptide--D-alanyl-D-alanine ligase